MNNNGEIIDLKLNVKELLNVSSGWKDNNNLRGDNVGGENGPINPEFQAKQIERIVEAIALTLPPGSNQSMHGLGLGLQGGNTLSTANLDSQNTVGANHSSFRYEDQLVKELAFDLGVDQKLLKNQLMSLFQNKI